jgi:hypothetical protein
VYAEDDLPDVVPSDFMRLLRVNNGLADPRFVFWSLWLRYHLRETLPFQTMTTNVRNLRIPEYLNVPILVPERSEQLSFVDMAEALRRVRSRISEYVTACSALRIALLGDLLSGDYEIPESYDALLEPA